MKLFLKFFFGVLLIAAFSGGCYWLYSQYLSDEIKVRLDEKALPTVIAYRVPYPSRNGILTATGEVSELEALELRSNLDGVIKQVFVTDGDIVNAGDPIFALDKTKLKQALQELRTERQLFLSSTQEAEVEGSDAIQMLDVESSESVPTEENDTEKTNTKEEESANSEDSEKTAVSANDTVSRLDAINEKIKTLQSELENAVFAMPDNAMIQRVLVSPGQWIHPGDPVLQIPAESTTQILVSLAPEYAQRILKKRSATVSALASSESRYLNKEFPAEIALVVPAPSGKIINIVCTIAGQYKIPFQSNEAVLVKFQTGWSGKVIIQKDLVHYENGQPFVFLIQPPSSDEKLKAYSIQRQPVELGQMTSETVEILYGLQPADLLAVRESKNGIIPVGQKVQVRYEHQKIKATLHQ